MSRHMPYHAGPIEAECFEELARRWPDPQGAGRALIFDASTADAQAACWDSVRRHAAGHVEQELALERQLAEPWCPDCRDRLAEHEPGDCPKYKRPSRSAAPRAPVEFGHDADPLKRILASTYLPVLAGVDVHASGRCRCPLPDHEDRRLSAKCYGARWVCFACGGGGDIFDLASALFGLGLTGDAFLQLRRELAAALLQGGVRHVG
jgi:hypothetical protein